jgi:hypothetical protein
MKCWFTERQTCLRKRGKRSFGTHVAEFGADEADDLRNEKATVHANDVKFVD